MRHAWSMICTYKEHLSPWNNNFIIIHKHLYIHTHKGDEHHTQCTPPMYVGPTSFVNVCISVCVVVEWLVPGKYTLKVLKYCACHTSTIISSIEVWWHLYNHSTTITIYTNIYINLFTFILGLTRTTPLVCVGSTKRCECVYKCLLLNNYWTFVRANSVMSRKFIGCSWGTATYCPKPHIFWEINC